MWAAIWPEREDRRRLMLSVLLALGAAAAAVALLATSGYLISAAAKRPPILMLMVAIVGVRAFGIARAGLRYAERLVSHDHALRRLARLRARMFERLTPLLPGRLRGGRGDLLARFVGDVDTLADLHPRASIPILTAIVAVPLAGVAAAALLSGAGPVVVLALGVPAVVLPALAGSVSSAAARQQAPVRARLTAELVQSIDGAAELALAGRSRERAALLGELDARLARLGRNDALVASGAAALGGVMSAAGVVATLAVGIAAVHSGRLSGVLLAALVLLLLAASELIAPLPEAARRLHACASAARRVREALGEEAEPLPTPARGEADPVRGEAGAMRGEAGALVEWGAPADPVEPSPAPARGVLALEGVRFRYGPDEPWVLDGAGLTIRPGERVALIGESGAGKSTLAELLVRFHDPAEGAVTLGGVDVRRLAQEDLRRHVLLCRQEAHLFNTSVRENLLLANREASDAELMQALAAVELTDWVAGLDGGLDGMLGQDGERTSGGQRRRLALARCLISGARFLVLDEPTAHLDRPLAMRVMGSVLRATEGRGVLLITHAGGPALAAFDRVLRLRDGRIADVDRDSRAGLAAAV